MPNTTMSLSEGNGRESILIRDENLLIDAVRQLLSESGPMAKLAIPGKVVDILKDLLAKKGIFEAMDAEFHALLKDVISGVICKKDGSIRKLFVIEVASKAAVSYLKGGIDAALISVLTTICGDKDTPIRAIVDAIINRHIGIVSELIPHIMASEMQLISPKLIVFVTNALRNLSSTQGRVLDDKIINNFITSLGLTGILNDEMSSFLREVTGSPVDLVCNALMLLGGQLPERSYPNISALYEVSRNIILDTTLRYLLASHNNDSKQKALCSELLRAGCGYEVLYCMPGQVVERDALREVHNVAVEYIQEGRNKEQLTGIVNAALVRSSAFKGDDYLHRAAAEAKINLAEVEKKIGGIQDKKERKKAEVALRTLKVMDVENRRKSQEIDREFELLPEKLIEAMSKTSAGKQLADWIQQVTGYRMMTRSGTINKVDARVVPIMAYKLASASSVIVAPFMALLAKPVASPELSRGEGAKGELAGAETSPILSADQTMQQVGISEYQSMHSAVAASSSRSNFEVFLENMDTPWREPSSRRDSDVYNEDFIFIEEPGEELDLEFLIHKRMPALEVISREDREVDMVNSVPILANEITQHDEAMEYQSMPSMTGASNLKSDSGISLESMGQLTSSDDLIKAGAVPMIPTDGAIQHDDVGDHQPTHPATASSRKKSDFMVFEGIEHGTTRSRHDSDASSEGSVFSEESIEGESDRVPLQNESTLLRKAIAHGLRDRLGKLLEARKNPGTIYLRSYEGSNALQKLVNFFVNVLLRVRNWFTGRRRPLNAYQVDKIIEAVDFLAAENLEAICSAFTKDLNLEDQISEDDKKPSRVFGEVVEQVLIVLFTSNTLHLDKIANHVAGMTSEINQSALSEKVKVLLLDALSKNFIQPAIDCELDERVSVKSAMLTDATSAATRSAEEIAPSSGKM